MEGAVVQVTPASYLELLTTFIKLLAEKRKDIGVSRQRLEAGLSKLLTTAAQVEVMQVQHSRLLSPLIYISATNRLGNMLTGTR